MTALAAPVRARPAVTVPVIAAAGCVLLTARPVIVAATPYPTPTLLGLFLALAVVGLVVPLGACRRDRAPAPTWPVLLAGSAVFAVGRIAVDGVPVGAVTLGALALHSVAAVSEEIWFRRLVFGLLAPGGRWYAIVGSAALFAAVHVTTYGLWVLPLDLAAGAVLAWQRDATGSWGIPAVTHVVANLLAAV